MASRRMDREMNGSRIRSTPTSNKTSSRDDERGYPRSGDSSQKQAASNFVNPFEIEDKRYSTAGKTSRSMEEISRGFQKSGGSYQKKAASTKNKKSLGGISNLYNANDSTGRMKRDIKNGVTPKTNSDNRGYPKSGDSYQKEAAQNASGISNISQNRLDKNTKHLRSDVLNSFKQAYESAAKGIADKNRDVSQGRLKKNTGHLISRNDNRGYSRSGDDYQKEAASNAKKPSDERNDTRGYARSGDSYQKQAARNAPFTKTSKRDDSRGYPRSGDSSQKQAAKNSSSKPSILNLEKAMDDYAAGKLNVKKVTSKPTTTKKSNYASSVFNEAFDRAKRMADNQRENNFKVIDVGETYVKPKKTNTKKKR